MAQLRPTLYTAWEFTEEEEKVAIVFPDLNYKYIQTELAKLASEKAALAYNPSAPNAFIMESEYLRGAMDHLGYLLAMSDERKSALQKHLEDQIKQQPQA